MGRQSPSGKATPMRHSRIATAHAASEEPPAQPDTALQKHWPRLLISRQAFHHNSAMPVAAVAPIVYADYPKDGSADREDRPEEMARFPLPGGVWPACLQHEE
jgi:hypothetical protein